jgi:uncharacterized protein (UPF0548 family)
MLLLRKPSTETVRDFLEAQKKLDFIYGAVGATAATFPVGFVVDHTRTLLGFGETFYQGAAAALVRWEHFRLGWVEVWPQDTAIRAGEAVAVVAAFGAPYSIF